MDVVPPVTGVLDAPQESSFSNWMTVFTSLSANHVFYLILFSKLCLL